MRGANPERVPIETGLFRGRVPFIKGGSGPRKLMAFFGANALFKRIDRSNPQRYARMVGGIVPPRYTFYLLGYDSDPPPGYGFQAIVDDVAAILRDDIGGGPATVTGISFGGFVAQRLAAAHPELVDTLILLVSAHRFSPAGRQRVARQLEHLRQGDLGALVRENSLLFRRPWFNAMVRLNLWRTCKRLAHDFNDPASIARAYEALLFSRDFERNHEWAARIAAPTLIIGGSADQFFDHVAFQETADLIASSRLQLFPRETHMLPVERRRAVAAVIARFLTHVDGSAGTLLA